MAAVGEAAGSDDAHQLDGYSPVNPDGTYGISSVEGEEFTKENPWACPGSIVADNTPANVKFDDSGDNLVITWEEPATLDGPDMSQIVYGYKVVVEVASEEDGSYAPLSGWNGKLFRTYDYNLEAAELASTGGVFELDTGISTSAYPGFKVYVTSYNVDGNESSAGVPDGQD